MKLSMMFALTSGIFIIIAIILGINNKEVSGSVLALLSIILTFIAIHLQKKEVETEKIIIKNWKIIK